VKPQPWSKLREKVVRLQERLTSEGEPALPTEMELCTVRAASLLPEPLIQLQGAGRTWTQKRLPLEVVLPSRLPDTAGGRVQMWFYLEGVRIAAHEAALKEEEGTAV